MIGLGTLITSQLWKLSTCCPPFYRIRGGEHEKEEEGKKEGWLGAGKKDEV